LSSATGLAEQLEEITAPNAKRPADAPRDQPTLLDPLPDRARLHAREVGRGPRRQQIVRPTGIAAQFLSDDLANDLAQCIE
jgi:hypothetical protein